jgi:hypothetical protein
VADDGHPWGKTTAQLRGLSRCEESTNGGRSRRLAGDGLPQGLGKSSEKGEASTAERFYSSRGERGVAVPHIGDRTSTSSWTGGTRRAPGSFGPGC